MNEADDERTIDMRPWVENWWKQTGNPLYAWEAIARSLGSDEPMPDWARDYLKVAAHKMLLLAMGKDCRPGRAENIAPDEAVKLVGEALGLWKEATKNAFARRAGDIAASYAGLDCEFHGSSFAHDELNRRKKRQHTDDRAGRIIATGKKLNTPADKPPG